MPCTRQPSSVVQLALEVKVALARFPDGEGLERDRERGRRREKVGALTKQKRRRDEST